MSAPTIQAISPAAGEADVVLGRPIEVLFDQPIDPVSVSTQTFSLMGPGQTSVVDAENLIHRANAPASGREYIVGTFSFPAPGLTDLWLQNQKLLFTPERSLRPNVKYTLLIVGKASVLVTSFVANPAGEALAKSIQTTFVTGELDLTQEPLSSPLAPTQEWEKPRLSPKDVLVRPRKIVGNDLTQQIELVFPGPIDPNSFDPNDIIVAGEPFLNDPETLIPSSVATVEVVGNKLIITVAWGADPTYYPSLPRYSAPGESGPVADQSDYGTFS